MEKNDINEEINNLFDKLSIKEKELIKIYDNTDELIKICKGFENEEIELYATFMKNKIKINNCNIIGDLFEDLFFYEIKNKLLDFEEGPKQSSPDFYGMNKNFEFEQKLFMINPGFDIGNFTSYVNQLSSENGVYRKLFNTKYLIFEYFMNIDKNIIIKKFHYLNVYNIVSYNGKYPISMQVKKNIWYNIRPDSVKNWYLDNKTPKVFIEKIIECINICPHIENKDEKINSINKQFDEIQSKYTF